VRRVTQTPPVDLPPLLRLRDQHGVVHLAPATRIVTEMMRLDAGVALCPTFSILVPTEQPANCVLCLGMARALGRV
jgi:hypothetical protein